MDNKPESGEPLCEDGEESDGEVDGKGDNEGNGCVRSWAKCPLRFCLSLAG